MNALLFIVAMILIFLNLASLGYRKRFVFFLHKHSSLWFASVFAAWLFFWLASGVATYILSMIAFFFSLLGIAINSMGLLLSLASAGLTSIRSHNTREAQDA